MTSIDALTRRTARLHVAVLEHQPPINFLQTAEWEITRATIMEVLASYPDARRAIEEAFITIAQKHLTDVEDIHYELAQALDPFLDARRAVAAALVEKDRMV
jgi:hypothetical protein